MPFEIPNDLNVFLHANHGKDQVRVLRVARQGLWDHVFEYNVTVLVEGDINDSSTRADNSAVVATDSMKNIVYYLAKESPHVVDPEFFALHLGTHIVSRYSHIHKAHITIEQLRWSRIPINDTNSRKGELIGHTHSFLRDGDEKIVIKVEVDATAGKDKLIGFVSAGITDLLGAHFLHGIPFLSNEVLKSRGSAFTSFIRDKSTSLAEDNDRVFSTVVDFQYTFAPIDLPVPQDEKKLDFQLGQNVRDCVLGVAQRARDTTLKVLAEDDSPSMQATIYKMGQLVLTQNDGVQAVTYTLPNKHYIPVDVNYIAVENLTP
ncbi:hypothetical protein C0993_005767 [Termitomyces sp. T159_Od127]|nr:hypothetical protein C0993_005767 [Termitomyces sp. T159_Od127]